MAQYALRQGKLSERDQRKDQQENVTVDVNSAGTTKHRTLGGELVDPGNDMHGWRWINSRSAVGELLDVNLLGAAKDRFYEIADQLLEHKEAIEKSLYRKEQEIVGQEHQVFLYDLTNTYFEGECAGNDLAKRGRFEGEAFGLSFGDLGPDGGQSRVSGDESDL